MEANNAENQNIDHDNNHDDNNDNDQNIEKNPYGPIYSNGVYNQDAHVHSETKRVERDLTISAMVKEMGQINTPFIKVEKAMGGTRHILTFIPNHKNEILMDKEQKVIPDLVWKRIRAKHDHWAGKLYNDAANGRIQWHMMILSGDITDLFFDRFEDDLTGGNFKTEMPKFTKDLAKFIIDYPHESYPKYSTYFAFINQCLVPVEPSAQIRLKIIHEISGNLRSVLAYKDKKSLANSPSIDVYNVVKNLSTKYTVQDCSKKAHYELGKVDVKAIKGDQDMDELERDALEEKKQIAKNVRMVANQMKKNNAVIKEETLKRPLPDVNAQKLEQIAKDSEKESDDNDDVKEPPFKKQKKQE